MFFIGKTGPMAPTGKRTPSAIYLYWFLSITVTICALSVAARAIFPDILRLLIRL